MTIKVLMVAEKPSICNSIAEALSYGDMNSRGRTPPVHEFSGTFNGKAAHIKVTSVLGHIFSTDFPAAYQNWESVDPAMLFSAPIVSSPESKGGIVKHLEREAANCDYLVLWLDCDREGENICFEVIRCTLKHMNQGPGQRIFRAKFSAVTPKDIEKAMKNLVEPNENESKAVEARQELDLKIGVAFSRFQTRYFQGKYGDLDSSVISYGPCQTPTLGFCVDRNDEIKTFTPEHFWTLQVAVDVLGRSISLDWSRGNIFDEEVVGIFLKRLVGNNKDKCRLAVSLKCSDISKSVLKRVRPAPINTVNMLKIASQSLGIGPHAAMRAAEHLYLSGIISYPRTESTSYPHSFNFQETLHCVRSHSIYGVYAAELLSDGHCHPRQGVDKGDHPPITPVGPPHSHLGVDERKIYDLVVRHFIASISPDATYQLTRATFCSECNEIFTCSSKEEIDPGFMRVYGRSEAQQSERMLEGEGGGDDPSDYKEQQLPDLEVDSEFRITSASIQKGSTKVPGHLTESELIGLMEKHGIGTDASIPTHINNIIVRNYVTLGPNRTLIPTNLGVVLVHGYHRIDSDLVRPEIRATIENFCDLIAKGKASKEEVVKHSLKNFEQKFVFYSNHIGLMDSLFEASFSPLAATGKFLSKCGKCQRYMRFIPLKPQRLYCPNCEETYNLPQNGTIKLYKELKCPLDQFELILFSLGNSANAQGKSYPLCPCCYNFPPKFHDELTNGEAEASGRIDVDADGDVEDIAKGASANSNAGGGVLVPQMHRPAASKMGCNECMHSTCKHSAVYTGMCSCPNTLEDMSRCGGTLVLDVNSKPNWKLACNQCNTLLRFHANIHDVVPIARSHCQDCGTKLAKFEFNKLKSPFPNGETSYSGCIICDDILNSLTEVVAGRTIHLTLLRQQRHKRGAFGGRGRGRGRKPTSGSVKMSFSDF